MPHVTLPQRQRFTNLRSLLTTLAILAIVLSFANSALALNRQTPSILANTSDRPTSAEIYEASREDIDKNSAKWIEPDAHVRNYVGLAMTIAILEHRFPNLIYAPLGRDAAYLGNLIDAFYMANGQPGRVKPLKGSGNSVRPASSAEQFLFLRQNGLRPIDGGLQRPYVVIDRTSYGAGSQARALTSSVSQQLLGSGGTTVEDLRFDLGAANTAAEPWMYQQFQRSYTTAGPQEALQIPAPNFTDQHLWHGTYDRFYIDSSGRIQAPHGKGEHRAQAVASMTVDFRIVMSPAFLKLVQEESKKIDLVFPIAAPPLKKQILTPFEAYTAALAAREVDEKQAVLRFLSWFDGPISTRLEIAESLYFKDPTLIQKREALLAHVAIAPELILNMIEFVDVYETLVQLHEIRMVPNVTRDELVSRATDLLENIVLLDEQRKILTSRPEILELFKNSLNEPDSRESIAAVHDLENAWQVEIADLQNPPSAGKKTDLSLTQRSALLKTVSKAGSWVASKFKLDPTLSGSQRMFFAGASLVPVGATTLLFQQVLSNLDMTSYAGIHALVAVAGYHMFKGLLHLPTRFPGPKQSGMSRQNEIESLEMAKTSAIANPTLFAEKIFKARQCAVSVSAKAN